MRTFAALLLLVVLVIAWVNAPLVVESLDDLAVILWFFTAAIVIALGK